MNIKNARQKRKVLDMNKVWIVYWIWYCIINWIHKNK